jgi:hypothetical protein
MKMMNYYFMVMMALAIISRPMGVYGTQIKFTTNENIQDNHKDAHYAPRSQKYWDENNIERPDYAKTDAEIMAEKGQHIGSSKLLSIVLISAISCSIFLVYAFATDNANMIANTLNWLLEVSCIKGHRLGTSSEKEKISVQEARLKRFQNQKDTLDNIMMKDD